jgi:hypothetical protein
MIPMGAKMIPMGAKKRLEALIDKGFPTLKVFSKRILK